MLKLRSTSSQKIFWEKQKKFLETFHCSTISDLQQKFVIFSHYFFGGVVKTALHAFTGVFLGNGFSWKSLFLHLSWTLREKYMAFAQKFMAGLSKMLHLISTGTLWGRRKICGKNHILFFLFRSKRQQ